MRIGVLGAGSIGCFVGGRLLAAGSDVTFVGRPRVREELHTHGLTIRDVDGSDVTVPAARVRIDAAIASLADRDVILCCVKSGQTAEVARELAGVLGTGTVVASLQNGVRNAPALRAHLGDRRVLAGIVGFNVVSRGGGVFHRGMSGPIFLDEGAPALVAALNAASVTTETRADLAPDQWTKLLVNLNNAVSALSGAPTRTLLLTPGYRRIVAAVIDEALAVLRAAGIKPAKLRGVPVGLMPKVLRLPTPLVRVVTRAQMKVDPEARSSMWEDLQRGRPTEVDDLNGEIVRLADKVGARAPRNAKIVELIREAERAGPGSPQLSADELWRRLDVV